MNATALTIKTQHALTFGAHEVKTITREGQLWMSAAEVGRALEYASPDAAIAKVFRAHADEFTATMTRLIKVATAGGKQAVRFFSLRGAHLLAMFARTSKAKEFRVWVLDILDREVAAMKQSAREVTKLSYNARLALQGICGEVYYMASWWKHFGKGVELLNPHAYNMIYERFLFAPSRADELVEEFELNSAKETARAMKWEWAVRERRKTAKMADRYTECAQ